MKTVLCVLGQIVLCLFVCVSAVGAQGKEENPGCGGVIAKPPDGLALSLTLKSAMQRPSDPLAPVNITKTFTLVATDGTGKMNRESNPAFSIVVCAADDPDKVLWQGTGATVPVNQEPTSETKRIQTWQGQVSWDFNTGGRKTGTYRAVVTIADALMERIAINFAPWSNANIYFTGALFGYFRLPNTEAMTTGADNALAGSGLYCPRPTGSSTSLGIESRDASVFFDSYANKSDKAVLLGTGDNFSPNYYSRAFYDPNPDKHNSAEDPNQIKDNHYEKELYDWSWNPDGWTYITAGGGTPPAVGDNKDIHRRGIGTIPTDNVGCFLSYAGYAAVVPGKHDFHYGPERLRELARFMASIPNKDDSPFKPVQMLGANIVIKTTWADDHKPIPANFREKHVGSMEFVTKTQSRGWKEAANCPPELIGKCSLTFSEFTDGNFVYPWMRMIPLSVVGWSRKSLENDFDFRLCRAIDGDPDWFSGDCAVNALSGTIMTVDDLPDSIKLSSARKEKSNKSCDDACQASAEKSFVLRLPSEFKFQYGQNYAVCATPRGMAPNSSNGLLPFCKQFSVFTPFFEFGEEPPSPSDTPNNHFHIFNNPDRYVLRQLPDGTEVVVFGVVSMDLMQYVGISNRAWEITPENSDHPVSKYKTQISIGDPEKALDQLDQFFEDDYKKNHNGREFKGIRVLLAQMTPTQGRDFASLLPQYLRFDVVITQADDELANPDGYFAITASSNPTTKDNTSNRPQTFIAVPPSHGSTSDSTANRLVRVRTLSVFTDSTDNWDFSISGRPLKVSVKDANPAKALSFWKSVQEAFGDRFCHSSSSIEACKVLGQAPVASKENSQLSELQNQALKQLALEAIRRQHKADVALLQTRDFYEYGLRDFLSEHCTEKGFSEDSDPCSKEIAGHFQEIMDRIIWKGDFIRTITVQGSVLGKVMDQSKKFDEEDKSCCVIVPETGRALVPLGIEKDAISQQYYVNGAPVDPNALYTVAVSDYISLGDTGYPDLATPPVGKSESPFDRENLVSIASATCFAITDEEGVISKLARKESNSVCGKDIPATPDYYDTFLNMKPNDSRKGMTNWQTFVLWTGIHPNLGPTGDASIKKQPQDINSSNKDRENKTAIFDKYQPLENDTIPVFTEKMTEERSRWEVYFDQLSFGLADLDHNLSEGDLANKFGGVLDTQATAKHSRTLSYNVDGKLTRYGSWFDLFFSPGLNYSSTITAQSSPPNSETQSTNLLSLDFGTYLHSWNQVELPNLYFVLDAHFETQVADPLVSIKLTINGEPGPTPLNFNQGRTNLLLQRAGFRWQNRKSYIEAGFEGGATLNSVREFDIVNPAGIMVLPCKETSESLQQCIKTFNMNNGPAAQILPTFGVTTIRGLLPRYGTYLNYGLTIPIRTNVTYVLTNTGDYFFNSSGDNSANTRFRDTFTHSLQFLVIPSLSFEPTLTMYLYMNKIQNTFLFQRQYVVKVNYSFDWTNIHSSRKEFQYKKPTTQQ
jgi:hypothetical protein